MFSLPVTWVTKLSVDCSRDALVCDDSISLANRSLSSSQRFPVDQRNGDGEAKCPAGRARVCPTVLHTPEPGPRLPAQVRPPCDHWSDFAVTKDNLLLFCWVKPNSVFGGLKSVIYFILICIYQHPPCLNFPLWTELTFLSLCSGFMERTPPTCTAAWTATASQ